MAAQPAGPRIAHLIETDVLGGAEKMIVHLAGALRDRGWTNVAILPAGHDGWLSRQLQPRGVTIDYYSLPRPFSPGFARDLARTLTRHRIDVAHSHEFTMAFYGAWAARRAGIPHLFTMHGGLYYAQRLRRRLALRAAAGISDRVVAVSDAVAERLARDLWLARSRVTTVPNGVPFQPGARATLRQELRLPPGTRLIVSVGTLFAVKGHQYLLEALARLGERHAGTHVAIAGRGDAGPLRTRATALGVADRVHLLGARADIPEVLASADLFALPSLSEGLPLALLEAMFAARPIVASAVGEVPAALNQGRAGLLVPPGDPEALAAALARLLDDPDQGRALGEYAAQRAAAEYGLERMVAAYTTLYDNVIGLRRTRRPG